MGAAFSSADELAEHISWLSPGQVAKLWDEARTAADCDTFWAVKEMPKILKRHSTEQPSSSKKRATTVGDPGVISSAPIRVPTKSNAQRRSGADNLWQLVTEIGEGAQAWLDQTAMDETNRAVYISAWKAQFQDMQANSAAPRLASWRRWHAWAKENSVPI